MISIPNINALVAKAQLQAELLYRDFHANPELSMHEYETAQRICKALDQMGIEYQDSIGKTGIIAIIRGNQNGPTIGIRAEMDALPIDEKTSVGFASKNKGVMHACGHDFHMANLLSTASILNELKQHFMGNVLLIFQPSEEQLPGGALSIMQSDAFKNNMPDIMLGFHVLPELDSGKVGFRSGAYMASGDELHIMVKGKGGHGALRQNIIDPVLMASKLVIQFQNIASVGEKKGFPTVLSIGRFIAQGATNVIPNEVELQGTFRTMGQAWREEAHELMNKIAIQIAHEDKGNIEVNIVKGYPSVYNHEALTEQCKSVTIELLGPQNVVDLPLRMTTDDFAYYSLSIPSVYFRIGVGGTNTSGGLHSNSFLPNLNAFATSIPLLAWLVITLSKAAKKL